ncbi:MAG: YdcF family protein [Anaerolineae bacterium]|nr:YdcF family protein [Anaerolineae bacterium]
MATETAQVYDAVLVPGGGLLADGTPPPWVIARLELARARAGEAFIITLSAGTTHKPPPLDARGFPRFESVESARYLAAQGVAPERILTETASYDTIGNAYFARVIHTEPRGWRRLLVITSEFHMARTRAIFEWVYGLAPKAGCSLAFEATPDIGIDPAALSERQTREAQGLKAVHDLAGQITSLAQLHGWMFSEHRAYATAGQIARSDDADELGAARGTY